MTVAQNSNPSASHSTRSKPAQTTAQLQHSALMCSLRRGMLSCNEGVKAGLLQIMNAAALAYQAFSHQCPTDFAQSQLVVPF